MASPAMLSALCASTLAPVAGLAWDPAAFTVVTGMVSSLGGNMLSGFFAEAYQRTREKGQVGGTTAPGRAGLEEELAGQIERVLAAGDDNARALSVEIAGLLRRVDAYGVMLKDGQAALLRDVVRAIEDLAARFPDMDLLRQELALAPREVQAAISASDTGIRAALDTQGATLQAMAEQSALESRPASLPRRSDK